MGLSSFVLGCVGIVADHICVVTAPIEMMELLVCFHFFPFSSMVEYLLILNFN